MTIDIDVLSSALNLLLIACVIWTFREVRKLNSDVDIIKNKMDNYYRERSENMQKIKELKDTVRELEEQLKKDPQ